MHVPLAREIETSCLATCLLFFSLSLSGFKPQVCGCVGVAVVRRGSMSLLVSCMRFVVF